MKTVLRILLGVILFGAVVSVALAASGVLRREPIRIGILHSLSGTMAFSESGVVDAALLAIDQINAAGGVLGRPLEAVVVDGQSDESVFAAEAERLITEENVSVILGCWTSACRRTVKPIFERLNHLLLYPVEYEGLEYSPNIIYLGSAPNQQIVPAVGWVIQNIGRQIFLVGSDYIFPRTANAIIHDIAPTLGGQIVGEEYVILGSSDLSDLIRQIDAARPSVVLNTINGDSNIAFFEGLEAAGLGDLPVLSFSLSENELANMDIAPLVGNYAAWTYFQALDTPENMDFVAAFQARYGADRVTSDPMEAAYTGIYLWAQAVDEARTPDPLVIRDVIVNRSIAAPQGVVYIDGTTHHTWKTIRIGQIRADGQFDIVWDSNALIRPIPYPDTRPQDAWDAFIDDLFTRWNGWENPGTDAQGVSES